MEVFVENEQCGRSLAMARWLSGSHSLYWRQSVKGQIMKKKKKEKNKEDGNI